MTNRFETLKQELINKGIIYDCVGEYEESQSLHSVYDWGYIIAFDCIVLPTRHDLYDNTHTLICSLDTDDDEYIINNGILNCKRSLFSKPYEFSYNLNEGAPIHYEDVAALLLSEDTRIIILKDGMVFVKEDGEPLLITDTTFYNVDYLTGHGYKVLSEDYYTNNINLFNDLLVTTLRD